jgi:acyl-CoA synthetase (AMP-forming)/AMP-acid ligase II
MIAPSGNLGDIIAKAAGEREAVLDLSSDRACGYAALDQIIGRFAGNLAREGFQRGDRIAIAAANGVPFLIAYLGVMRAGMVAVPVNHKLASDTIAFILADCGAVGAVVDEERASLLSPLTRCFIIGAHGPDGFETLLAGDPVESVSPLGAEIAEILYTSGSTGRPKGVTLSHRGQVWALRQLAPLYGGPAHRALVVAPMYHMNGLVFATLALASGMWLGLLPSFEPRGYLNAVAQTRSTMLSGIPTMFAMAARERDLIGRLDLTAVTQVIIGSAPLTEALVERVKAIFPNATLSNSYGTTEAGPIIFGAPPTGLPRPALSLGYPAAGVELRLVGANADQGELELRTPSMMEGYLNLPDTTAERLASGWFKTGDILRRDGDGFYYFLGRADDMFVCGGENIYPGEVEKLIERHPAVLQAAVLPAADEIKGQIPIAFVVTVPGAKLDYGALRDFCLTNGPAYMHPRAIEVVESLPLGGSHKVDKRQLTNRANEIGRGLAESRAELRS